MLAVVGLVLLLVFVYGPAQAVSAPSADSRCHSRLASSIAPLPRYSPKDVWINYSVNGSRGDDGARVRWVELWYQGHGSPNWTLYAPPWNPTGHFPPTSSSWHGEDDEGEGHGPLNGTIIFDTSFTGGDGFYNFTSVAAGHDHRREPGPPKGPATVKANTTVDSVPPVLFIARPTPGSWTNSEWLQWQATDATSGVAGVSVTVDSGELQHFTNASGSMNMSLATQGQHTVVVTAADRAGNAVTIPVTFRYDTTAPTLEITSPPADAYLNATDVNLTWSMEDPAGISDVRISADSAPALPVSNTTTSHGLNGLSESRHVVSVLATDPAGNQAFQSVAFTIDRTPPSVQIILPVSGSYSNSRGLQTFWNADDSGSGIDHSTVALDGGEPVTLSGASGYIFSNVSEGIHTIRVTAVDRAGNTAVAEASVTVDTTPPVVVITAPLSGATLYGSVSVNWSASDSGSGLDHVALLVSGAAMELVPIAQTTLTLPSSLTVGPHAVTVLAWDKAGNMNQTTVAFDYGGASPPGPGSSSLPAQDFWWVLAAVLGIAVVSAYVAVRRRGRRRT